MVSRMLHDLRVDYGQDPQQIRLSNGFRMDLNWWRIQLGYWNGKAILDYSEKRGIVTLDACKFGENDRKPGLGAFNFDNKE